MEARISKENASRWKKGGSSRDSCLRSLLLLYLGVTKREREEKRTCARERQSYDQLELSTLSSTVPFLSHHLHPLLKRLFELFRSFCFFTAIVARPIRPREFDQVSHCGIKKLACYSFYSHTRVEGSGSLSVAVCKRREWATIYLLHRSVATMLGRIFFFLNRF